MDCHIEEYSLQIVNKLTRDTLDRYPVVEMKITGVTSFDRLQMLREMFEDERCQIDGATIEMFRTIHVWCRACRGYIGNRTMPLKINEFRICDSSPTDQVSLNSEAHICNACGDQTNITIQDPLMSIY